MSGDVVIRAEGLGKKYAIGHQAEREPYYALRDAIARGARGALRKTADLARGRALIGGEVIEQFWALKDVSFEVKRGEVLGIIGRNGAGKSTLLKILSRITEPSAGRVEIYGRVASLLEVGTGFHPELTGRENIYLNGAILGMTRAEIKKKFDEIVAFAEIEKFLDTPVKRYSSGMYVRLAFAVAAHLEPEILVVDEVLAVGDAEFQKKCLGKMDEVSRREGRTVLLVSHNMNAVRHLSDLAMLIDDGRIITQGRPDHCIRAYHACLERQDPNGHAFIGRGKAKDWGITNAWLAQTGFDTTTIRNGFPLEIFVDIRGSSKKMIALECIFRDRNRYPIIFCPFGLGFGYDFELGPGVYRLKAIVNLPLLAIGQYSIDLILAESGYRIYEWLKSAVHFDVEESFSASWAFCQERGQGTLTLPADLIQMELVELQGASDISKKSSF